VAPGLVSFLFVTQLKQLGGVGFIAYTVLHCGLKVNDNVSPSLVEVGLGHVPDLKK
jgi:hypothetical protein